MGKFHDEHWWASKTLRGTAPARCMHVPTGRSRCRAEAVDGTSCGRRGHGYRPTYDLLGMAG